MRPQPDGVDGVIMARVRRVPNFLQLHERRRNIKSDGLIDADRTRPGRIIVRLAGAGLRQNNKEQCCDDDGLVQPIGDSHE